MMSFVLQFVADMDWYAASIYLFHFIEQSHSFRQLKKTHKWKTVHTQKKKTINLLPRGCVWCGLIRFDWQLCCLWLHKQTSPSNCTHPSTMSHLFTPWAFWALLLLSAWKMYVGLKLGLFSGTLPVVSLLWTALSVSFCWRECAAVPCKLPNILENKLASTCP